MPSMLCYQNAFIGEKTRGVFSRLEPGKTYQGDLEYFSVLWEVSEQMAYFALLALDSAGALEVVIQSNGQISAAVVDGADLPDPLPDRHIAIICKDEWGNRSFRVVRYGSTPLPEENPEPLRLFNPGVDESKVAPAERSSAAVAGLIGERWNLIPDVVKVRDMRSRKKNVNARMRDAFWVEHWEEAIEMLCDESRFQWLRKSSPGWSANIDWFLRPGTVVKIIEGYYSEDRSNVESESAFERFKARFAAGESIRDIPDTPAQQRARARLKAQGFS